MSNLFLPGTPPYLGTKANMPPNAVLHTRRPTVTDINYSVNDFWIFNDPAQSNFQELWYLASLQGDGSIPGYMAKWVLLSDSSGGDLLQLTADDLTEVQPILGNINIFGSIQSPNMFTTGDIPTGSIHIELRPSILLPETTDADHGVIALGADLTNDRFIHNYGAGGAADDNAFIGRTSGNFALEGTLNTGLGASSLFSLTTGSRNTAIGARNLISVSDGSENSSLGEGALFSLTSGLSNTVLGNSAAQNLVSGDFNVIIGSSSGDDLVAAESSLILINNVGVNGESNTIRIGTQGNGDQEQDSCFVAGITGVTTTTTTPKTVVNVGTDGELGETLLYSSDLSVNIMQTISAGKNAIDFTTAGGGGGGEANPFSFSYVQVADTGSIVVGTNYQLGQLAVLLKLFDVGNLVFPGDGAGNGAYFTAPVTGKYYLEFYSVNTNNGQDNGAPPSYMNIITSKRTYQQRLPNKQISTFINNIYTVVTDMDMGDTATFNIMIQSQADPTATFVVRGNTDLNSTGLNSTRISGFLIPEGGTGGNFSQPFLGVQQVTSAAVPGNTIIMGANAIMNDTPPFGFDIGANFDPGDGVGAPASFTCPIDGIYEFSVTAFVKVSWPGAPGDRTLQILVNGIMVLEAYDSGQTGDLPLQFTGPLSLTALDIVTFAITTSGSISITLRASPAFTPAFNNITFISGKRIA